MELEEANWVRYLSLFFFFLACCFGLALSCPLLLIQMGCTIDGHHQLGPQLDSYYYSKAKLTNHRPDHFEHVGSVLIPSITHASKHAPIHAYIVTYIYIYRVNCISGYQTRPAAYEVSIHLAFFKHGLLAASSQ